MSDAIAYQVLTEGLGNVNKTLKDHQGLLLDIAKQVAALAAVAQEKDRRCNDHSVENAELRKAQENDRKRIAALEKIIAEWTGAKGVILLAITVVVTLAAGHALHL